MNEAGHFTFKHDQIIACVDIAAIIIFSYILKQLILNIFLTFIL